MKISIAGKTYDTDCATRLAAKPTYSGNQELHQTGEGEFFLFVHQIYVDGRRLGPNELWIDLNHSEPHQSRLSFQRDIIPLGHREALEWCIKTQVPETLRGYLLECI